ncbi:CBU_0592 family membrane protein [Novosphingobium malaysiense]
MLPLSHETANIFGFAGMACIIFVYAYITGRVRPNPFVQHGVNLLGACLLTVSLLVNMNPPSLVLEGFWAAIAIWGLAKAFRARRQGSCNARHNEPEART